jgi:hypothetical protein
LGFLLFTGIGVYRTSFLFIPIQQIYSLVIYSVRIFLIRDGVIIKLSKNGKVVVEQVEIVDYSCTLFHVVQSVDMLWESGIVPKQKEQ